MKKLLALILAGAMLFALAACGTVPEEGTQPADESSTDAAAEESTEGQEASEAEAAEETEAEGDAAEAEMITGGWTRAESPVITDDIAALVDKGTESLLGATYTPVAYVANQVVAGMNHCVLCKQELAVPDAVPTYALLVLYEDLNGNVEVTEVLTSTAASGDAGLLGGWNEPETPELTEEASTALENAAETLLGADYSPIAYISDQVVSGMNYCLLCEVTPVVPNPESSYKLVYVYVDTSGNAQVTDVIDFAAE
ncbi:MAG: hypothetical protein IJG63_00290 [Oscillospiraceae bacterium]|nr:hypothetical protein [Oscillospiraceae bacterium]